MAELVLHRKIEEERAKHQQEKQRHKEEHRKEEESRKQLKDAKKMQHNADATAAMDSVTAQLISPSKPNPTEVEMEDLNLKKNLFQSMTGGGEEDDEGANHSPPKNKPKKSTKAVEKPIPTVKHAVKSALKAGFNESHIHNFPRILVEAFIELKGKSPVQEFIVCLQELLKNGQMANKNFTYGGTKNIHNPSSVPTNMTLLSAHFKILSMKGKSPFKKQKVWKNNKEVKGEFCNPIIYFSSWQSLPTRNLKISWCVSAMNGIGLGGSS